MLSKASLPQPGMILALLGTYLASFGEGMCIGFPISSKKPWNELFDNLNVTWFQLLLPIGAIFGTLTDTVCNQRLGRNKTITVGACKALIAMTLLIVSNQTESEWALYIGVFTMGAACGVVSHTAPTYLHEVSHFESRGKIVSGHPAAVAVGLSLSLLIGPHTSKDTLTCLSVLPFVFSAIVLALSPASPLWLAEKDRPKEEIECALKKLHGESSAFAQNELQLLTTRRVRIFSSSVTQPSINRPLVISMGLMLLQQLSGVSGFIAILFDNANISYGAVVAFCVTHIIVSILAVFLQDPVGRKTLLYISSGVELLGLFVLGVSWSSTQLGLLSAEHSTPAIVVGVCIFVGGYSIGAGPIPWVMINELLPSRAKTYATAASTTTSWLFDTIITEVFVTLMKYIGGPYTFLIFSIFVVVSFVFVFLFVPETSGLTIQELEKRFRDLYERMFVDENITRGVVVNDDGEYSQTSHGEDSQRSNGEDSRRSNERDAIP